MKKILLDSSYYNTTKVTFPLLKKYAKKAENQNFYVLEFFRKNKTKAFTPMEVALNLDILFTSVRRSISSLTKAGKLVNTGNKKAGSFGRQNFTWKLK